MTLEPAIVYKSEMQIDLPQFQNDPRLPGLIKTVEEKRAADPELNAIFEEMGWTNRAYALGAMIEADLEAREGSNAS